MKVQNRRDSTVYILNQLRFITPVHTAGARSDLDPHLSRLSPMGVSDGIDALAGPRAPWDIYAAGSLSRRVIVSGNHAPGIVTDETDEYDNDEGFPLLGYVLGTLGYTIKLREVLHTLTDDELNQTKLNGMYARDLLGSVLSAEEVLQANLESALELDFEVQQKPLYDTTPDPSAELDLDAEIDDMIAEVEEELGAQYSASR